MGDGALTGAITGAIQGGLSGYANHLRYGSCFVAGTTVATATGLVAIEKIKAGDLVWAWDEETGDVALKPVVETYINETTELTHIFVGDKEIVATPTHPFYCPVKGWTDAAHLRADDILVLVNGEYVVVEKIQHELLESPVKVYNFQVEDYHTYYVANGVLVHNKCIVNEGGVRVDVRTSNEHGLPHAHVSGNGPNTTVGLDGLPMRGHPSFSKQQIRVIKKNWEIIKEGIKLWFK